MTDPVDRLTAALVASGIVICGLVAIVIRPAPFPASAGPKWASIETSWTGPRAGLTYALDTVVIGRRQARYAGGPQVMSFAESFDVHGWAFDPNFRRSADRFVYRIDGSAWNDATYHIARPDVAATLHLPKVADSGFDVVIPARTLSVGRHTLQLGTMDGPSPPVPLPETLTLVVTAR